MFPYEDSKSVSVCLSVPREKRSEVTIASSISVLHYNWYINGKVFTSITPWKPKNSNFFQKSLKFVFWLVAKSWNHLSFVNISPTLVIDTSMGRFSRVLHHGNPKIWFFFFKKVRNWIWLVFWLVLKIWNQHTSRSQHAPICRHRGCIVVPLRVDI